MPPTPPPGHSHWEGLSGFSSDPRVAAVVRPFVWVENPCWFVERVNVCRGRGASSRRPLGPSEPVTPAGLTAQEVQPACFLGQGPADAPRASPQQSEPQDRPPGGVLFCLVLKRDPWQLQGSPGSADRGICVAQLHVQTHSWASTGRSPSSTNGAGTSRVDGAAARQTGHLASSLRPGGKQEGAPPGSAFLEQLLQRGAWGTGWHSVSGSLWRPDAVAPGAPRAVRVKNRGELRLCLRRPGFRLEQGVPFPGKQRL